MANIFPSEIKPDRIREVSHEFNTTIKTFEKTRNKQRFANQSQPTERFRLEWNMMSLAEMQVLLDHFDDRRGAFRSFSLPDDRLPGTKIVWFTRDTIRFSKRNHYFADVSVEVET